MNILLIFFALPIATIIISIALQKILRCPLLVAAVIFAIFLIFTFIINNLNFLVAAIIYAIISFITAAIVCIICRIFNRERENCCCNNNSNCRCNNFNCNSSNDNSLAGRINVISNSNNNDRTCCLCGRCRRR